MVILTLLSIISRSGEVGYVARSIAAHANNCGGSWFACAENADEGNLCETRSLCGVVWS